MPKRTTVDLTDADEEALKKVMRRWGQQNESAVIRLCLHMVANAKEMLLQSPEDFGGSTAEGSGC
jgi:hypothetical protein